MFGIGGFNPVSLLATTAFGPAGGLFAQLATQVLSSMGQQIIQRMGDQLGLPQSSIDMAQGSFASSYGDFNGSVQNLDEAISAFGSESGASFSDVGTAQRDMQASLDEVLNDLAQSDDVKAARSGGGKAPSWLMAMAQVLGAKMDEMSGDLMTMAREISDGEASKSSEFTALSMQFNLLMNASSTGIKTIGESLGNMARKQ